MKMNQEPLPLLDFAKVRSILSEISLLGGLSETQLRTIFSKLRILNVKKDDIIFKQDEQPSYIYIVLTGQVKIVRGYKNTTLELLLLEPGQCCGETSLIGIQPHSATAIAAQDCELIILSRDALLSLFENDKELYSMLVLNIARETSRHLRDSREHFAEYAITHPTKSESL